MSEERIRARFKIPVDGKWIPVDFSIKDVNFTPPAPRITDLTINVGEGKKTLTYLGESRTSHQLDVTFPQGKFLGPVLRQNIVMSETNSIIQVLGDSDGRIVDSLYPMSDDYEVYGVWGLLDLLSGGLA